MPRSLSSIGKSASVVLVGLLASATIHAQSVDRGPYLQLQTDDGITIQWRTNVATDSVVRYGTSPSSLTNSAVVAGSTTAHSVTLAGLDPAQQYYYSVGDSIAALAGDASYHFYTAPTRGAAADTRIWVIGDSGTGNADARNVRDAFKTWSASNSADFWIMLGDNAYNSGTQAEYQTAVFETYPEILRQLPLWATLGNHDGQSADSATQTGAYYDIFKLPKNAEVGGWPSGTEAYYSFDYANIHFICLDSYDSDRSVDGSMLQWLESDLAINNQPWVIAFWHHPPYTKGSHNSDSEAQLIDMRQNALPLLEAWGVDLVLSGHSHTYERSYLLDGHYGASGTLDPVSNVLDPGDGADSGDGAYEKPDILAAEHAGAVYAVAGSSGKVSTGYPLNHPAMFLSIESLGSLVIDLSGNRLDATFLDQAGVVKDQFTVVKTPDFEPPLISAAAAVDVNHVRVDFNEPLNATEAGLPANYAITGLAVSQAELLSGDRSVLLTTSAMSNGASYTLQVSNVRDLAGNTIVPGSSVNFDFFELMTSAFQDGISPGAGYGGTRDATIRQASPATAHGLETTLQVDGDEPAGSGTDMNILTYWDISAIPVDAIVESAHIQLQVTNISSGVYYCYNLLASWQESEVTWNQAAAGTSWGAPGAGSGGDRGVQQLCTVSAGNLGPLTLDLTPAGLAQVQSWVTSASSNHGMIISHPTTADGADFHSRESVTATARPKLEVTYRVSATPGNINQFALADLPTAGAVNGSYAATTADDGNSQSITERESGGKRNVRYSYLSHSWQFSVTPGASVTLYANAWSGGSSDGDAFVFAWSSDNSNFNDLFTVTSTADNNLQSAMIPASGTIYIRVHDSDQTAGHKILDTVFVDQLFIRTDNAIPADPPLAPTELQITGVSSNSVTLAWLHPSADETGFELERAPDSNGGWAVIAAPGGGSSGYTDSGLDASTTYFYRLRALNAAGFSAWTDPPVSAVTSAAAAITLSASGFKNHGVNAVDLNWSGASSSTVDIMRDGAVLTNTVNDGSYTDNTGTKGGRTYIYAVCAAGSSNCSDDVVVAF